MHENEAEINSYEAKNEVEAVKFGLEADLAGILQVRSCLCHLIHSIKAMNGTEEYVRQNNCKRTVRCVHSCILNFEFCCCFRLARWTSRRQSLCLFTQNRSVTWRSTVGRQMPLC